MFLKCLLNQCLWNTLFLKIDMDSYRKFNGDGKTYVIISTFMDQLIEEEED